ncbi:MAG: RsmB/NOP family class I SAM-dependent RNA methyltransferase [Candidatus Omnitrophota bacterium]
MSLLSCSKSKIREKLSGGNISTVTKKEEIFPILPAFFERLEQILPDEIFFPIVEHFFHSAHLTVRINTLKIEREQALRHLTEHNISFNHVSWFPDALSLSRITPKDFERTDLVKKGFFYRQGLSSMLPVVLLDPQPGEAILDMCAAPGSKTTQIAALMHNKGSIVAIEKVRNRFYKLKSVLDLLGVQNVSCKIIDARRYHPQEERFDKILLDAPCSSEGRFNLSNKKTYSYWSIRKIKEMARKQKGLILNATRLLKPGGVIVYATCTFAPEENEAVIDWLLRRTSDVKVMPITLKGVPRYEALKAWQGKKFNPQVDNCLRVFPTTYMEGFFIAKIAKANPKGTCL